MKQHTFLAYASSSLSPSFPRTHTHTHTHTHTQHNTRPPKVPDCDKLCCTAPTVEDSLISASRRMYLQQGRRTCDEGRPIHDAEEDACGARLHLGGGRRGTHGNGVAARACVLVCLCACLPACSRCRACCACV